MLKNLFNLWSRRKKPTPLPHEGEHPLVAHFLNPSPDFASGFECGLLYAKMRLQETRIDSVLMVCSIGQAEVMAGELGYAITQRVRLNDEFVYLFFICRTNV